MINAQVGKRYAEAIYKLAEEKKEIKELYENLSTVMELYVENKDFKNLVDHPLVSSDDKKEFITKIFKGIDEFSLEVLHYLIEKNRLSDIRSIVAEFLKIYYEKNQIIDVEGIFALEITEDQKKRLMTKLEKRTGKKVNLEVKVDKSIIAGGIIKIGDEIIDGSLKRQLDIISKK